jgi:hypothetical protein
MTVSLEFSFSAGRKPVWSFDCAHFVRFAHDDDYSALPDGAALVEPDGGLSALLTECFSEKTSR